MTRQSEPLNKQPISDARAPTQPPPGQTPTATITATNQMLLATGHINGDHRRGQTRRPAVSRKPTPKIQRLNAQLNGHHSGVSAPTLPINVGPLPQPMPRPLPQTSLTNPLATTLSDNMFTGCTFRPLPKYTIVKRLQEPQVLPSLTDRQLRKTFLLFRLHFHGISFPADTKLSTILAACRWKIQLRFSHTAEKGAKDSVPEHLCIDLNGTRVDTHLTDDQQRWCRPYDVSQWCRWGGNDIRFSLSSANTEYLLPTLFEVSIVSEQTAQEFVDSLTIPSDHRLSADASKELIRRKVGHNSSDDGISVLDDCIKVSLICPISLRRVRIPCRTVHCQHIECFDGQSFFAANEWRSQWLCPICKESADISALRVDTYFEMILANTPEFVTTIRVKSDGNYAIVDRFDGQVIHLLDDSVTDEDVVGISGNTEHSL